MRRVLALSGAAAVAAASVITLVALPGHASATSPNSGPAATAPGVTTLASSDDPRAAYTRGFTITNLGSYPMKLVGVADQRLEDSGPPRGSILEPGESARFDVTWVWWYGHTNLVDYLVLDGRDFPNRYAAELKVVDNVVATIQESTATIDRGRVTAGGDELTVADPDTP